MSGSYRGRSVRRVPGLDSRGQYQLAARRLKAARRAATSAGATADFEAHVLALRELHRRRPAFLAILDKAGLP